MQRTILALILAAATVLSTTPASAGRKAVKPPVKSAPPSTSLLTTDEQACQFWGKVYGIAAAERDKWIPITTTIDSARKVAVSLAPDDPTYAATLAEHMVEAVRRVYATPKTSPVEWRYLAELRCMTPPADHAPAATGPQY